MKKLFSALNEMPLAPIDEVAQAAALACAEANLYPTPQNTAQLAERIGRYLGVPPDWVVIANGSLMILHQVMIASGQRAAVYGWPTFIDYPTLADGLRMKTVPVDLCQDGSCDLSKLAEHLTDDPLLAIVCTPNPPTGGVVSHKAAKAFLGQVPPQVTVLFDEAYGEFVRSKSAVRSLELVRDYPNVVVSRSFSKAFGLAGLRVGYAIAQPEMARKIAMAGVPRFEISVASQAAALAALDNLPVMQARIDAIVAERGRMAEVLRSLKVPVVEGHGNFLWLPVGELAQHVKDTLAQYGVLVSAHMPFGVRVTVGTGEATDTLRDTWQKANPLDNL